MGDGVAVDTVGRVGMEVDNGGRAVVECSGS